MLTSRLSAVYPREGEERTEHCLEEEIRSQGLEFIINCFEFNFLISQGNPRITRFKTHVVH